MYRTFLLRGKPPDRGEVVEQLPQLHDLVGAHKEILPERVDNLLPEDPLDVGVLGDVVGGLRPVEEPVKDPREGEHGEEGGVEVARVLVTLDALVAPAHPRHVAHLGEW